MKSIKGLVKWYLSKAALPYWGILLLDCIFVVIAGFLIYVATHGLQMTLDAFSPLVWTICAFTICYIVSFRIFHTYDGVIRYSSFYDLLKVSEAALVAVALVFVLMLVVHLAGLPELFDVKDVLLMAVVVVLCM